MGSDPVPGLPIRRPQVLDTTSEEIINRAGRNPADMGPEERFIFGFSALQTALEDIEDPALQKKVLSPAISLTTPALNDIRSHPDIPEPVKLHIGASVVSAVWEIASESDELVLLLATGWLTIAAGMKTEI